MRRQHAAGGLLVLGVFGPAGPTPQRQGIPELTHLQVCNHGSESIYAFSSTHGTGENVSQTLSWLEMAPGGCNNVYAAAVPNVEPAYIGFAVKNRDGRLMSVLATVPNYGKNAKGGPLFTSASTAFCALPYPDSKDFTVFSSKDEHSGEHCDEWVSKKISDPARRRYASFSSSIYFQPSLDCGVIGACKGGAYHLDVNIGDSPGRLTLTRTLTPIEQGFKFLAQLVVAYEKAKADTVTDYEKQVQLQNRFARFKPGSAMSWQQQWAQAPQLSAAQYDSSLAGSTVVVRGVIDHYRIDADPKRFPHWITIYFRDAPNGPFVVCSPYPDMFQEVVGMNLNALVGKTLEAVGPVEGVLCSGDAPNRAQLKASIRVLESGMFHIK